MNVYIGGANDYSAVRGPCSDGFHIANGSRDGKKIRDILTVLLGKIPVGTDLNTYLLLPNAGYLSYITGELLDVGVGCCFWTRNWFDLSSSIPYINGTSIGSYGPSQIMGYGNYNRRGTGYPIRPIKDTEVVPDNSWTTLLDGSSIATGAGVFHNLALGLISLSSDGEDWITIADKNLGATSSDISSTNSYGYYYQWGNNYGFTAGSIITSSTRVDASSYGPGNYYNSSTFIKTSNNEDWSTVQNNNLRGGVTGIVSPAELKGAYIGEKPFELEKIFDFTTADLHGFTYRITGGSGLTIDTSDYWCTRANANYSNGVIYKSAGYSHCRQRMKANFNYSSGIGGMILGIGQYFVEDNKCGFGIGIIERTTVRIFKYGDVNNYSDYSLPSGWNANTDYYYDLIFDNGTLTAEIYDTSMNKIFSQTFSGLNSTIPHIGFCMFSGTTSQGAAYIKEYRLAYEE